MEAEITGRLKETIEVDGKPFGFVIETEHIYDIPSEPLFPGDDHYDWKYKVVDLYFTTFEDSIKNMIKNAKLGNRLKIIFIIKSKNYQTGWLTHLNPRIIENIDAKDKLHSRVEIIGIT